MVNPLLRHRFIGPRWHIQADVDVVALNEREELGTDDPATNGPESHKHHCKEETDGDDLVVQRPAQEWCVNLISKSKQRLRCRALYWIHLRIALKLGVRQVGRKEQESLDQRNGQRRDDNKGHFREEISGSTVQEEERREGDNGRQYGTHYRRNHLYSTVQCCTKQRLSTLKVRIDVLGDDNPVVHENTDNHDHTEQRDNVDGNAEIGRQNEHPCKRNRDTNSYPEGQTQVQEKRQ